MSTLKALRDAHLRLISENPTQVTVTRATYTRRETGGRAKQETTLPTFTGRLLPRTSPPADRQTEAGARTTFAWTLLAPYDADLQVGDQLEADGRTYRVQRVIERQLGVQVYAKQALLEEVQ